MKKYFLFILCTSFLVCLCHPVFSQNIAEQLAIEIAAEGAYPVKAGVSKELAETMALFKAKRAAVELAGKYFRRKQLIEPHEHKRDEIYNILADEIKKEDFEIKKVQDSTPAKYGVKITVKIEPSDFIRAEILNLQYEKAESKANLRKKMEPSIEKNLKPGHCLAHAYRLIRKAQWRPAIIYLDRLEMKLSDWDDIYLAKSVAYYSMHELEAMQKALTQACRLGAKEACEDLEKIKRLHEHDFSL